MWTLSSHVDFFRNLDGAMRAAIRLGEYEDILDTQVGMADDLKLNSTPNMSGTGREDGGLRESIFIASLGSVYVRDETNM